MTDRPFIQFAELAQYSARKIVSRDGVEIIAIPNSKGEVLYFLNGQQVAERTAEANYDYIRARLPF